MTMMMLRRRLVAAPMRAANLARFCSSAPMAETAATPRNDDEMMALLKDSMKEFRAQMEEFRAQRESLEAAHKQVVEALQMLVATRDVQLAQTQAALGAARGTLSRRDMYEMALSVVHGRCRALVFQSDELCRTPNFPGHNYGRTNCTQVEKWLRDNLEEIRLCHVGDLVQAAECMKPLGKSRPLLYAKLSTNKVHGEPLDLDALSAKTSDLSDAEHRTLMCLGYNVLDLGVRRPC